MNDQEWIAKLRDALEIPDIRSTDEPDAVVETLETEVTGLRSKVETQKDQIATLTADAKDGKAYRLARIDEALKQGNRAYGDEFDEDYHREYYTDMPLEKLEDHIAQNKKKGMRCYRRADQRQIRMNRRQKKRSSVCVNANGGCVSDKQSRLETLPTRFTQESGLEPFPTRFTQEEKRWQSKNTHFW